MYARKGDLITYTHPNTGATLVVKIPTEICSNTVLINNKKACLTPYIFKIEDPVSPPFLLSFVSPVVRNVVNGVQSLAKVGDVCTVTSIATGSTAPGTITSGSTNVI